MGVPKFFRWISERYPMVITKLCDPKPEIDNLYLDMNGIIHVCCRTEDDDKIPGNMTEEHMVRVIYSYLEFIFSSIMPKKRFFMAIDGVAPRAKMNQQRQRRFRKVMTPEGSGSSEFDSNCITPGTSFMLRLSACIEYFIQYKISTHAAWQMCEVIYSSHQDPGEGEHKIMAYIRSSSHDVGFLEESHCLYGLDADLVMLALSTHIPNFVLLRETVHFGTSWKETMKSERIKAKGIQVDGSFELRSDFVLFHVKILREYIGLEMQSLHREAAILNRIIDDFIFICFCLGNDFLPGLPGMSIADGAIAELLAIYKHTCLDAEKFIICNKRPDWAVLKHFFAALALQEWNFISKKRKSIQRKYSEKENGILSEAKDIRQYRKLYYKYKLGYNEESQIHSLSHAYIEGLVWVCEYYYRGCPAWGWYFSYHYAPLASDLVYSIEPVPRISFAKGEPFTPYEQLIAVLPRESYQCVPKVLQKLMCDADSPLNKNGFYPVLKDIPIDREGCRNDWEGVMLLPFIDENFLRKCYEGIFPFLTKEERQYNSHEPTVVFQYDSRMSSKSIEMVPFKSFPRVESSFVRKLPIQYDGIPASEQIFPKQIPVGTGTFQLRGHMVSCGYSNKETKVFGQFSRNPSMIIDLSMRNIDIKNIEEKIGTVISIGYPFVKPAILVSVLAENSKAYGVFDQNCNLRNVKHETHDESQKRFFRKNTEATNEYFLTACGLRLGKTNALLHVKHVIGIMASSENKFVLRYETNDTIYPVGLLIEDDKIEMETTKKLADIPIGTCVHQEVLVFPAKGPKHQQPHGTCGRIESVYEGKGKTKKFRVSIPPVDPFDDHAFYRAIPENIRSSFLSEKWKSSGEVCFLLRIPHRVLLNVCDSILCVHKGKDYQLGLQLIDRQAKLARLGFAKLVAQSRSVQSMSDNKVSFDRGNEASESVLEKMEKWYFSKRALGVLRKYLLTFRTFVDALPVDIRYPQRIDIASLNPWSTNLQNVDQEICRILLFLKKTEGQNSLGSPSCESVMMVDARDDILPHNILMSLEKIYLEKHLIGDTKKSSAELVGEKKIRQNTAKTIVGFSMSSLVFPFIPGIYNAQGICPTSLHRHPTGLLQRVVYFGATGTVPFGARGTIIRMLADGIHVEVLFDHPYLECTHLKHRLQSNRGTILKKSLFIVTCSLEDEYLSQEKPFRKKKDQIHDPSISKEASKEKLGVDICNTIRVQLSLNGFSSYEQDKMLDKSKINNTEKTRNNTDKRVNRPSRFGRERASQELHKCIFGSSCMINDQEHRILYHSADSSG